jgi:hypothetical protein
MYTGVVTWCPSWLEWAGTGALELVGNALELVIGALELVGSWVTHWSS